MMQSHPQRGRKVCCSSCTHAIPSLQSSSSKVSPRPKDRRRRSSYSARARHTIKWPPLQSLCCLSCSLMLSEGRTPESPATGSTTAYRVERPPPLCDSMVPPSIGTHSDGHKLLVSQSATMSNGWRRGRHHGEIWRPARFVFRSHWRRFGHIFEKFGHHRRKITTSRSPSSQNNE